MADQASEPDRTKRQGPDQSAIDAIADRAAASVEAEADELVDLRRAFHRMPELGHGEHKTTAAIVDYLNGLGLEQRPAGTETGAVFMLEGGRPGKTVLLRADIDGLPIQEDEGPLQSGHDGAMHACGHDGHTSILLATARALASTAEDLPGNYAFLFQPAEEGGMGAKAMIDAGVLDGLNAERTIGLHLAGPMPVGLMLARKGVQNAESRGLRFHLHGQGAHAAMGGDHGNVLLAAAAFTASLADIAAGLELDGGSCVCAPGTINAGTAPNVVPRTAQITGTIRAYTDEHASIMIDRLDELAKRMVDEFGVEVHREETSRLPRVVNDADCVDTVAQAGARLLGDASVITDLAPVAPSDDMSEFLNRMPGVYFVVGANIEGTSGMHHSPEFSIDEAALPIGAKLMAAGAINLANH